MAIFPDEIARARTLFRKAIIKFVMYKSAPLGQTTTFDHNYRPTQSGTFEVSLSPPTKRRPDDATTKLAKHHGTLRGRAAHRVRILGGASQEVWHDLADAAPR